MTTEVVIPRSATPAQLRLIRLLRGRLGEPQRRPPATLGAAALEIDRLKGRRR
jgi:hypothetical protein